MGAFEVYNAFKKRGVPDHVAAGIMGNMAIESGGFQSSINEINPLVKGSRGGFGLNQWTGPRRRAYEAFAQKQGSDLGDVDTQVDFTLWELQNTEKRAGQKLVGAKTAAEAANIYEKSFLRPGIPHSGRRQKATQDIWNLIQSQSSQDTLQGGEDTDVPTEKPQFTRDDLLAEAQRRGISISQPEQTQQTQFSQKDLLAEAQRRGLNVGGVTGGDPDRRARLPEPVENLPDPLTTGEKVAEGVNRIVDGALLGFGDEINAAGDALIGRGTEAETFGERYDERLDRYRSQERRFKEEQPLTSAALETGGAVASALAAPAALAVKGVSGAAKVGAATGATFGFAEGEGGLKNRLESGAIGAATGAVFGAAGQKTVDFGSKAFRRLFQKSADKPTMAGLMATKRAAYQAVDSSGERFKSKEMGKLFQNVMSKMDDANYVPETDVQTKAVLKILEGNKEKDLTLGQLDKLRQNFWKRFSKADNEVAILDAIDGIDEMIAAKTDASDLMSAARLANSRFKKAELLDRAWQKAEDQTASTGSGGNILNKRRQAVTSIINDPKRAKWFSEEEINLMRTFVHGDVSENVLRKVGKLSPNGNGLMTALNLMAVSVDPTMLAVSATTTGAKAVADRTGERGAQQIFDAAATGVLPAAPTRVGPALPVGASIAPNSLIQE